MESSIKTLAVWQVFFNIKENSYTVRCAVVCAVCLVKKLLQLRGGVAQDGWNRVFHSIVRILRKLNLFRRLLWRWGGGWSASVGGDCGGQHKGGQGGGQFAHGRSSLVWPQSLG